MTRHMKLLVAVAGVSLLALTTAGNLLAKGPKPKSAMYIIQGHVCSEEGVWDGACDNPVPVEIGVNVTGWIPEDGSLALQVSEHVLDGISSGTYYGRARLIDHYFTFEFDTSPGCKLITYDTPLPVAPEYCHYALGFWNPSWDPDANVEFTGFTFADFSEEWESPGESCPPDAWVFCRKRGEFQPPLYAVRLLCADEERCGRKPGKGPKPKN